jgi:hypothetical protein
MDEERDLMKETAEIAIKQFNIAFGYKVGDELAYVLAHHYVNEMTTQAEKVLSSLALGESDCWAILGNRAKFEACIERDFMDVDYEEAR